MAYKHIHPLFFPDILYRILMGCFLLMYSDKSISNGKLVIDVTYFFFHVHSETHNFCDGTSCPATGEFVLASEQTLPSFTPPVSIDAVQCVVLSANYTSFSRIKTVFLFRVQGQNSPQSRLH
jgi:hypothetical protein